jgi:nucleoside-diphosphate-sugar epimerase
LCYGRPERVPIPVDHPTRPITSYGITKTAGEAYVTVSELSWASLRLANICGPRLAIGPIPTFYQRLKDSKKCFCSDAVRDFLDMADFIELMDLILQEDAPIGIFNASTGFGHSIKEVFEAVAAYLQIALVESASVVPVGADDIAAVVLDPAYTFARLGWEAKVDFTETIRRVLCWYDALGVSTTYSHLKPPAM